MSCRWIDASIIFSTIFVASCAGENQNTSSASSSKNSNAELAIITEGAPTSCNLIDVRNGVPCAFAYQCPPGPLAGCDRSTCLQMYQTGTCVANCSGDTPQPTTTCQKKIQACAATQCTAPTPPPGAPPSNVYCQEITCAMTISECNPATCQIHFTSGKCDLYWHNNRYQEKCFSASMRCPNDSMCYSATTPVPTTAPIMTPPPMPQNIPYPVPSNPLRPPTPGINFNP